MPDVVAIIPKEEQSVASANISIIVSWTEAQA
jgi:hypothetical protein